MVSTNSQRVSPLANSPARCFFLCFSGCILLALLGCVQGGREVNEFSPDMIAASYYTTIDEYPVYDGADLGLTFNERGPQLRVWAPTAYSIQLRLYADGDPTLAAEPVQELPLDRVEMGTWLVQLPDSCRGMLYTLLVSQPGNEPVETVDPYAKAVGVNGQRGCIIDPAEIAPPGWEEQPEVPPIAPTDAVIWEVHIRDFSSHPSSGNHAPGLYGAFVQEGTGVAGTTTSTGLDHIRELGVTHVHLLPAFDYASVDERPAAGPQYNWGYDPLNYNVPEGSYAAGPTKPESRIWEFKNMVMGLHNHRVRVVMDVVYNHTGPTENSAFNVLAPNYYYRQTPEGDFANASGCGNEIASERPMARKFIVESVAWWATHYKVDGFRFDLMGILDVETMNAIRDTLDAIRPGILMYGEGWAASEPQLLPVQQAMKRNTQFLPGIAAFCDELRDGAKGHWAEHEARGFVSGAGGFEESIKFGVVGAVQHPQINYQAVNYSEKAWAAQPGQCVNYVACHDDLTLWDKLAISNKGFSAFDRLNMHKLAGAIVLTSQGIPFLHSGQEFARSKNGNDNSYNAPDSVNQINWQQKVRLPEVFEYYKGLVHLRRTFPAFRLQTAQEVRNRLHFLEAPDSCMVLYTLAATEDTTQFERFFVAFNGNPHSVVVDLPEGNNEWYMLADRDFVLLENPRRMVASRYEMFGHAALILAQ